VSRPTDGTAGKRRTESGGYRRDHLRALAQRVEVDAKEVRIMGSKTELLRTLVAASSGGVLACPVLYKSGAPVRIKLRTRILLISLFNFGPVAHGEHSRPPACPGFALGDARLPSQRMDLHKGTSNNDVFDA